MICRIELSRNAEKFLKKAPRDTAERIHERLRELSENPVCEERLRGVLKELCKSRVGSYRIAYLLRPCTVIVVDIGHREKFYDKLKQLFK